MVGGIEWGEIGVGGEVVAGVVVEGYVEVGRIVGLSVGEVMEGVVTPTPFPPPGQTTPSPHNMPNNTANTPTATKGSQHKGPQHTPRLVGGS